MRRSYAFAVALLLLPGVSGAAEDIAERMLSSSTQIYLRWDGIDAHKEAYSKTSLGQMMKGDTGTFVTGLFDKLQTTATSLLTIDTLRRGLDPKSLKKMQADGRAAARLFPQLGKRGFILAGELRQLEPPQGDLFLILPGMGADPDPLFGALRVAIDLAQGKIQEQKLGGRVLYSLELGPLHLIWWVEGPHAVLALSTDKPEELIGKIKDEKRPSLSENALFQSLTGFKKFETNSRAFVDLAALVQLGTKRGKETAKLLDDLGLKGLRGLVLYSGFDGRAERGLIEWDMPGPRKGLLTLLGGKPFKLGDVPPLPTDVVSWSMTNFDASEFFDAAFQAAEQIVSLVSPEDVPQLKQFVGQANELLGVDVRKDLLGSLGDRFAYYTSPSDGPFTLGQTVLLKVRDADKIQITLEKVIQNLATAAGKQLRIKKRDYQGVMIHEVHVKAEGFIFVPSYATNKGWLVLGWYPQAVQAFVQRSRGGLPVWKPSPLVQESLDKLPKEFVSISYSDPRPSLKQLMSIAPLIAGAVSSFNPTLNFEVGSVPATQEVTKHLFPNISVTSFDGNVLRQDSLDSLALPLDISGLDTYSLFLLFGVFGRFLF